MASDTQLVNAGLKYVNGLEITRTGNTTLAMAAGQARDSTNQFDIIVPNALTLNAANNGVNGLDTGTFAASKMYAVYLIYDPTQFLVPAMLLSLADADIVANPVPVLPFGYGAYRLIGYWGTDGSTHFYVGNWSGNGSLRTFYYDALLVTPLTTGSSNTFVAVDLSNLIPNRLFQQVDFYMNFAANAAGDTAAFRPTGSSSTNGQHIMTAQAAAGTAHLDQKVRLLVGNATAKPEIDYKVSAGTLAIDIEGFTVNLN